MRNLQATVTNYHSPITSHEPLSLVNMLAIAVFLACLFLFCSNAGAAPVPYDINNTGTSNVYGIYKNGDLDLPPSGYYFGSVRATTTSGSGAFGLYSDSGNITITGAFGTSGLISGTAVGDYAYGLCSYWGSITTGAIDGTIRATATNGSNAYAMWADPPLIINGDITGTISAYAYGSNAYALYSDDYILVNGDITSTAHISATAGEDYAYGLFTYGSITTGNINGTISATATNGSYAYALYSDSNLTIEGDIGSSAQITAMAGTDYALGLFSDGSLTTGAINGTISATAGTDYALGLFSDGSLTTGAINGTISATARYDNAAGLASADSLTTGAINGNIVATAGDNYAYGLYSDYGSIITGAINGTISATAGEDSAFGLFTYGSITTGNINGTISATAGTDYVLGLFSDGSLTTGSINGTISATATDGSDARALYSYYDLATGNIGSSARITAMAEENDAYGLRSFGSITTGAINGTISATAGDKYAYGLYSDRWIDTDAIDGTITATAGTDYAYGLYSNGSLYTGNINGTITATAGDRYAYGLYSNGSLYTGNINGTISATAGEDSAFGLFTYGSITTGNINGTISATAGIDNAFGLFTYGSITTGDIDGTITATAGTYNAYGLFSDGSLTTGVIRGTISTHAGGDFAYGILSYGPMDVTIDGGTVSAVADDGTNVAAIQSGRIGSALETKNANDTVEIAAGSTIVGNIDLALTTDDDTLILSGVNTNSTTLDYDIKNVENIYITGGRWHINGTVSGNANGIEMSGGILSGTGTLGSLNVTGGTLAPGNSIGTMTVNGDLTLDEDSVFEVEVNNSGQADKVVVTGTANLLDGTIRGKAVEPITHWFEATVIDANGRNGEFLTLDKTLLNYRVTYDDDTDDVTLHFKPKTYDFTRDAVTKNEHSVGNALNALFELNNLSGYGDDVLDAISYLPNGAAVNRAYDQMMPQDALGQSEITRNAMNQYGESVFGRMGNVRNSRQYAMSEDSRYLLASAGNTAALPPKTDKWMPFAKGFGSWGDRDAESDIAGYKYNVYGMTGGIDKLVSDNTLVGLSVGGSWANVNYSQSGTSSDIDSAVCSLYGSYFVDNWHVDLTAGYGHSWYDSQRGIHFGTIDRQAESDHQGNVYSAAVELGNNFGGKSMLLEPVVGLGYTLVQESGYKEKGAGDLNLKVDSDTTDGIYSKLGLRVAKEFRPEKHPDTILVPNVSIFWLHDYADRVELSSSLVGGGSFTTEGHDPVRDSFNLGAGLNIYLKNNVRLFVDYGWQSASNFNSNTVQAGAQWSF